MTSFVETIPAQVIDRPDNTPLMIIEYDALYPAMVQHIVEDVLPHVSDSGIPRHLMDELAYTDQDETGAKRLIRWAASLSPDAWEWALMPRGDFMDNDPRLDERGQALDIALAWYNRAVRMECRANNVPVPDKKLTGGGDYRQ